MATSFSTPAPTPKKGKVAAKTDSTAAPKTASKANFKAGPQNDLQATPKPMPTEAPAPKTNLMPDYKARFVGIKAMMDQKEKLKEIQKLYVEMQLNNDPILKEKLEKDNFEMGKKTEKPSFNSMTLDYSELDTIANICLEKYPLAFRELHTREIRGRKSIIDFISDVELTLRNLISIDSLDQNRTTFTVRGFLKQTLSELKSLLKESDIELCKREPMKKEKPATFLRVKNNIGTVKRALDLCEKWTPEETEYIGILKEIYCQMEKIRIFTQGSYAKGSYELIGSKNTTILRDYEIELDEKIFGVKSTKKAATPKKDMNKMSQEELAELKRKKLEELERIDNLLA